MPKQLLEINNFAGGLNSYSDPRDIEDSEFQQNWNAIVDKAGVIRVAGMGEHSIATEYHHLLSTTNFQPGYGLFQFSSDYSTNAIDGKFASGIKTGTASASTSSIMALEATANVEADAYNSMIVHIYEGTGLGQTRRITATTDATPTVLSVTPNWSTNPDTTSKYIIYRWDTSSDWDGKDGATAYKDVITNGSFLSEQYLTAIETRSDNYYIYSKKVSITDDQSSNLGYMEYKGGFTIKPGIQYHLSFDCAAKDKWYNMISDGSETGSGTTHGDKVPWIQLYSTTVADTVGSIKTMNDESSNIITPTTGEGTLSATWTSSNANTPLGLKEAVTVTGVGTGAKFFVAQNASNEPLISTFDGMHSESFQRGQGYKAGDTLRIYDPEDDSKYCTLTVNSTDVTGYSLYHNEWVNGNGQPNYLAEVDANYIDNGDFADGVPSHNGTANEWTEVDTNAVLTCVELGKIANTNIVSNESEVSISTSEVTLTVDTTNATDELVLNKRIYKSDGTFIGKCTSVNSVTEIVLDGAKVAIPNDTTLYAGNQYDQSPYDRDDGTCKMTSTTMNFSGGPESYIYQNLTLDIGTPYHLNFLYDSPTGIMYKIENTTTSEDIIPWTILGTSRKTTGTERYVFGGALYNTKSKDVAEDYTMNYIKFIASGNNNSDTIQIKFAPSQPNSYASLHGVTVYKAHNDLVTMSYNKAASNPFGSGIESFSNYSISFILPNSYTEVSDWVLRFHAGQYGYRASNNINAADSNKASNGQEVYFDNIRLTSEEGDTITLLSNNSTNYSQISLHSSLASTWDLDFFRMQGLKTKPVYNYINGMLKISDANFSNSNGNLLTYYDKLKGWKKISEAIPPPPNLNVRDVASDEIEYVKYDAINTFYDEEIGEWSSFLNKYFANENFYGYNWSLAQYGSDAHHGLVVRYFRESDCLEGSFEGNDNANLPTRGRLRRDDGSVYAGSQSFLYNVNSDYYKFAFIGGDESYGTNPGLDSILNTGGFYSTNYNNGESASHRGAVATYNTSLNLKSHNPLYFAIKGEDLINGLGMNEIQPSTSGDVRRVQLTVDYLLQGVSNGSWDWGTGTAPPFFRVRVGKIADSYTGTLKDDLINGDDIPFDTGAQSQQVGCDTREQSATFSGWMILADNPISTYYNHNESHDQNWQNTWFVEDAMPGTGKVEVEAMTLDSNYRQTCRGNIRFNIEFTFDKNEIKRTDDILVSIEIKKVSHQGAWHTGFVCDEHSIAGMSHNLWTQVRGNAGSDTSHILQYSSGNEVVAHDISYYERFKINNAKVEFYTADILDQSESPAPSGEVSLEFSWANPRGTTAMGWGGRKFMAGVSSVNTFEEESSIMSSNATIGESSTGISIINPGFSPNVKISMSNNYFDDDFLSKTKFYLKDTESDIWYLQFYIDHKTKLLHTTMSGFPSKPEFYINKNKVEWSIERENLKNFNEVNSYESESSVSQEDAKSNSNLSCRYKTSVVANNRLYVGNILQNGEIMSDRMIKSPIGKYNLLPKSNFIDVAINDGDEITALAFYKDKLLQFKKRKVFVISTSGDYEFLEDTFDNVGVNLQASVCTTPYGIVWANKSGLYLYDGKELKNLIENKIPVDSSYTTISNNYWLVSSPFYSNNPVVGFDDKYDILIIKYGANDFSGGAVPDAATYHFATNSFTFNFRSISAQGALAYTGDISNMITNQDGEILYYRYKSGESGYANINSIKKWTHAPVADENAKAFYFTTKDFTFGNIAVRKKLYKVYITYKTNSDSNVAVNGAVDGNTSNNVAFSTNSKFKGTTTACYGSSTLDSTGNEWKTAELKFDNPSLVNNVYSFKLEISSALVASDFEINDISISFKTKRVK